MTPVTSLLLGLAALLMGPVLAGALARRERLHAALDGFVLCIVAGLCLAVLFPHALEELGAAAVPLGLLGFAVPLVAERWLSHHKPGETPGVLVAALAGLLVHEALDGAGLAMGDGHGHAGHHHEATTLAILFHRLPVGLLVWWSVEPALGRRATWGVLGLMAAATVTGFGLGHELEERLGGPFAGVLNALLSGALLHVIFDHGPERGPEGRPREAHPTASAIGALLALACWAALPIEVTPGARTAAATTLGLLYDASPALLLGFLGAGALSLVPGDTLARLMTGKTILGSALRGTIFGLPLPVCSCGVVPVYRGLVQKGVPPAAAMAFLIATPELGVDAVLVSIPLLGLELSLVRLIAALVVALAAGLIAGVVARRERAAPALASADPCADDACADDACPDDACADEVEPARPRGTPVARALHHGFVESVDDLAPWILAGLLAAGALQPVLDPAWLAAVPPAAQVPLATALGAPVYVCASAATPVAAVLLAKGLGAGAVIAFLLTGPATNVTTWGAIRTRHGRGSALLISVTVLVSCVVVGLVIHWTGVAAGARAVASAARHEHHGLGSKLAAAVFLCIAAASFMRVGPRGFLARLGLVHRHGHAPGVPCEPDAGDAHAHAHDHDHDHEHEHGHGHGGSSEPRA